MKKFDSQFVNIGYAAYRWISQFFDPIQAVASVPGYFRYGLDWFRYSHLPGAEKIHLIDTYPCIKERTFTTWFDAHYLYQNAWAFKRIYASRAKKHVDVGSHRSFVSMLTAVTHVTFIDIRPLEIQLENYVSKKGDILNLPYKDKSIASLSCLHVAEHIGLGRYGDPLDPDGTKKACKELARVLAPGGRLYFSLPVGKPRLCFNAHRIHSPKQIRLYFSELSLLELSGVTDNGELIYNINEQILSKSAYACGLFVFTRKK